jgi:hypothetical protein
MVNRGRAYGSAVLIVATSIFFVGVIASPVSAGPKVASKSVEPAVIPGDGSSGAVVMIRTDLPATAVTIDLQAGGTVAFTSIDSQTFSVVLTSAQLLVDYQPNDVNRNFVGRSR